MKSLTIVKNQGMKGFSAWKLKNETFFLYQRRDPWIKVFRRCEQLTGHGSKEDRLSNPSLNEEGNKRRMYFIDGRLSLGKQKTEQSFCKHEAKSTTSPKK